MSTARQSKRYRSAVEQLPADPAGSVAEAVRRLQRLPSAGFDESVELACRLEIDPKRTEQSVPGTVRLPHGTGKTLRVVALCAGDDAAAAREAGADVIGVKDVIDRIAGGWLEFDVLVATPTLMREIARLGKILGPRGLMPSPKAGTVTTDMATTVREIKAGKIEYKMDKLGNVQVLVGRRSFAPEHLTENVETVLSAMLRQRSAAERSAFLKSVTLSSTMSPGVRLDVAAVVKGALS